MNTQEQKNTRTERRAAFLRFYNLIRSSREGSILILTLVFMAIFLVTAIGLVGFALSQNKLGHRRIAWERSFEVAEAGVNYYRWHLAHDPNDYQDGTGAPGPYVHDYADPYGTTIGQFSLDITPPDSCSTVTTIESTGWTIADPNVERVVRAQHGLPSLAQFAFLTNSNVWYGEDEELHGPVHSNGGIRQDGENDGLMTSAKATYICGSEHGCSNETKPGIWGTGEIQALWDFPVPAVDFNAITADLVDLKNEAQSTGIYLGSSGLGYHMVLLDNGTFDLYQVNSLRSNVQSYDGTDWIYDSYDIQSETYINNYVLPSSCSTVYVEDDLWIEGEINNMALTVVSAVLPDIPQSNSSIVINGDITYKNRNEQTALALISQKDILIPLYAAPDDLEVNAVLLAQKGHAFRNYYTSTYSPYHLRDYIELYGAIITNGVWTWSWVNGSGTIISGYENTETIYDPTLKYFPPPGFPTENEYEFIQWEEVTDK